MTTLIVTLSALAILVVGIFMNQDILPLDNKSSKGLQKEVLSQDDEISNDKISDDQIRNDESYETDKNKDINSGDDISDIEIQITQAPSDDSFGNSTFDLNTFKYPNSQIQSSTLNSYLLISSDNPTKITDWYKQQIRTMKMNVTSFVTTSTNDRTHNELVGARNDIEVKVNILKEPDTNQTKIEVNKE